VSEKRLHILIVCNHGVDAGPLDRVGWWAWCPHSGDWWPQEGDGGTRFTPMEGADKPGWSFDRMTSGYEQKPDDPARRMHCEIVCRTTGCTEWMYRSPDDSELQSLFGLLITDARFQTVFPVFVDEDVLVLRLDRLQRLRDLAVSLDLLAK
jgi:hypothetical protein